MEFAKILLILSGSCGVAIAQDGARDAASQKISPANVPVVASSLATQEGCVSWNSQTWGNCSWEACLEACTTTFAGTQNNMNSYCRGRCEGQGGTFCQVPNCPYTVSTCGDWDTSTSARTIWNNVPGGTVCAHPTRNFLGFKMTADACLLACQGKNSGCCQVYDRSDGTYDCHWTGDTRVNTPSGISTRIKAVTCRLRRGQKEPDEIVAENAAKDRDANIKELEELIAALGAELADVRQAKAAAAGEEEPAEASESKLSEVVETIRSVVRDAGMKQELEDGHAVEAEGAEEEEAKEPKSALKKVMNVMRV